MAPVNKVKATLAAGGTVVGTWAQTASPTVANALAHAGMDFVTVDMEHGNQSFETAEAMLYAVEAASCTPMIRLGKGGTPGILRALEIGCQSLLVAHCQSAEEAEGLVAQMRYPPAGGRGLAPFTRLHDYSSADLAAKLAAANEQQLCGVLVEDGAGLEALPQIVDVEALDLVYLGVFDISQAMGRPGEVDHPEVVAAVREAVRRIGDAGLAAGAVARDREHLAWLLETGFRYISYLCDTAILAQGFREVRSWYDDLVPPQ
jgi:4-hydroxy-2-oxoheptanedioate aldolase